MPGFMRCVGSARKSLISGHRIATICVGLGVRSGSAAARRRITRVGGHADQQAGLGGAAEQHAAGPVELDAEHQALAADLGHARRRRPARAPGRPSACCADRGGVVEQAVFFHDAQRLDAGAHRQRIAAEGGAVVARAEHVGRLRAARPPRRPARPSPGPWPAASRRARCRPTGARTTCRCGRCRTAPRRSSAASRFSSHSWRTACR